MSKPVFHVGQRVNLRAGSPNLPPINNTEVVAIRTARPGDTITTTDYEVRVITEFVYFYKVAGSEHIHGQDLLSPWYPPDHEPADAESWRHFTQAIGWKAAPVMPVQPGTLARMHHWVADHWCAS